MIGKKRQRFASHPSFDQFKAESIASGAGESLLHHVLRATYNDKFLGGT